MNQEKENQNEGRQDQKAGGLSIEEKPAEPLEHGPPVEPAEQPAKKSLSEQADHGTYVLTTEPARTCSICGGPDHRGCGCEARQKRIDQDNNTGLANLEKELERDEVLEKVLSKDVVASTIHDQLSDIITILNMLVSQSDVLIELEKSRRDLIRDIQNGSSN